MARLGRSVEAEFATSKYGIIGRWNTHGCRAARLSGFIHPLPIRSARSVHSASTRCVVDVHAAAATCFRVAVADIAVWNGHPLSSAHVGTCYSNCYPFGREFALDDLARRAGFPMGRAEH